MLLGQCYGRGITGSGGQTIVIHFLYKNEFPFGFELWYCTTTMDNGRHLDPRAFQREKGGLVVGGSHTGAFGGITSGRDARGRANLEKYAGTARCGTPGQAAVMQTNALGQLPLHVLLSKGLPGHEILLEAYQRAHLAAAATRCPVTNLYSFKLAARNRPSLEMIASIEDKTETDPQALSQVFLLL